MNNYELTSSFRCDLSNQHIYSDFLQTLFSYHLYRSQTNTTDQTLHSTNYGRKIWWIWQFTTNLPTTAFILADLLCRVANLAMCVLYQNAFGQLSIKLLHSTAFGRNPIVIQSSVVTPYHSTAIYYVATVIIVTCVTLNE